MKTLVLERERIGKWVKDRIGLNGYWAADYQAVAVERGGKLIAGVVYDRHSGNDCCMHVSGIGYWATPGTLRTFFSFPFMQWKYQRVTALVASKNHKCLTLVDRLGFTPEGRLREGLPNDDLMIFGMLRRECRWLEEPHGQVI